MSVLLVVMLGFNSLYAGDDHEASNKDYSQPYSEVEEFTGDFSVVLNDDNTVTASWDDFSGEGFDWYKLVYSTTNSDPVYPNNVVFIGNEEQTESTFKLKNGDTHYIRICAITVEENYKKGLYCSDVETLEVEITSSNTIKVTKTEKVESIKEKTTTVKKAILTDSIKTRVDNVLEWFFERLEAKGYSTDQKITAIDKILTKLETLKEKNERYERLVNYMIEQLEEYVNELDDGIDALEEIFEDF